MSLLVPTENSVQLASPKCKASFCLANSRVSFIVSFSWMSWRSVKK